MDELETNYESFGIVDLGNECAAYYARKKGRSHIENGTVCQDYCLAENIDSQTQVVCLADGHGGKDYIKSDIGSRIACEVFRNIVKTTKNSYWDSPDQGGWLDILNTKEFKAAYIQAWKKAVIEDYLSEQGDCKEGEISIIKKYGTTFLFVVYTDDRIAIGQLGDGAILLLNDYDQCQLFKRHEVKISSRTSSLASNRAEYAFYTDIYECSQFSYVLLSTDGIYDKLDNADSFMIYANSLIGQIIDDHAIKKPFYVKDIDVSEISRDDCTIAMMVFKGKVSRYELPEMEESQYEDVKFKRSLNGIEIYEAKKKGKIYELHVVGERMGKSDLDLKSCNLIKEDFRIPVSEGRVVYAYSISDNWKRISELMECGEHLEKVYWFNDEEKSDPESIYSNEYWLDFYEKMLQVKEEFESINVALCRYAFECAFVTEKNEIKFLSDSLHQVKGKTADSAVVFNHLFERFSIIGRLKCGKISIPLFDCICFGQNIVMLHAVSEKQPLCRVIFNPEKKVLGLWNVTDRSWNIEKEKRKEIPAQGVLRLNKDHVFNIRCDEKEITQGAELIDGYARYEVNIFRRAEDEKRGR